MEKSPWFSHPVPGGTSVYMATNAKQSDHTLSTAEKDDLGDGDFAFPAERKEPLTDARHVRNAVARFNQVKGVSDAERDKAWRRIKAAAKKFDVDLSEQDWRELAHGGKKES